MSKRTPLAEYRKREGVSAEQFSKELKVNRATIYRWENGTTPIPVKHLKKLEEITGAPRQSLRPDLFVGLQAAE